MPLLFTYGIYDPTDLANLAMTIFLDKEISCISFYSLVQFAILLSYMLLSRLFQTLTE